MTGLLELSAGHRVIRGIAKAVHLREPDRDGGHDDGVSSLSRCHTTQADWAEVS